jgi:hypothetical protein
MPDQNDFELRWTKFIEKRAQRLRVSKEEASKPLASGYLAALKEKADRLGLPVAELSRQQKSRTKLYPTPQCLVPSDLTDFLNGEEMPAETFQHLSSCLPCFALLDMAAPPEEGLKLLLEEVRILVSEKAVQAEVDLPNLFEVASTGK